MNWVWPTVGNLLLLCMTVMIALNSRCGSSLLTEQSYKFMRRDTSTSTSTPNMTYVYPTYDNLIVFGDSNTQFGNDPAKDGYVSQLAEFYQRQMDVLNRGFRGYNTSAARAIIDKVLPKTSTVQASSNTPSNSPSSNTLFHITDKQGTFGTRASASTTALWPYQKQNFPGISNILRLIIIMFGTNDSHAESAPEYNSLDQYAEDLQYFISLLQSPDSEYYSPETRILIVTPPVVGDRTIQELAASRKTEPVSFNNRTKLYAEKAIQVAQAANVAYADLYTTMEGVMADYRKNISSTDELDGYDKYLIDGIHLNSNGSAILFNLIHETITKNWPEMIPLTS